MKARQFFGVLGVMGLLLFLPPLAPGLHACFCDPWLGFDETIREVDIGLIGRVVAQGRPAVDKVHPTACEVGYLDLEVVRTFKGGELRKRVRAWDARFCTDCSVGLHRFPVGSILAFALVKNDDVWRENWGDRQFEPAPDDLLIQSCGDYMKRFASLDGALAFAERLERSISRE